MSASTQPAVRRPPPPRRHRLLGHVLAFPGLLRRTVWRAVEHGAFSVAKGAAYSAMLTFFPALLIVAFGVAQMHNSEGLLSEIAQALGRVLPPSSARTVLRYFHGAQQRPFRVVLSASSVVVFASSGVMISWMDGFRRAYGMERCWGFWKERGIALLLIVFTALPMSFATLLVAFGLQIQTWLELHSATVLGPLIVLVFTLGRWSLAVLTSLAVITLIYHHGLPRTQPWSRVLPGAVLATGLWFPSAMLFGWYVTRYATYSVIYGPIGATIALLVWLYMLSVIVLLGAELNAQLHPRDLPVAK